MLPNTVFPPVLISIEPPPSLLILSPRDQIKLEKTILLKSDNSIPQRYKIEDTIENLENKSVLISDIGGLSTFTATVKVRSLESTLSTTAHEWFHNYMIFKPLGRGYFNDDKLRTINETAANIFGDEIAKYISKVTYISALLLISTFINPPPWHVSQLPPLTLKLNLPGL